MFGVLVGAGLGYCWKRAGAQPEAIYVDLGPGRGTLASDALRMMRAAGFDGEVHFIETSPVLRDAQRKEHRDAEWHESLLTLPEGRPLLVAANEFFDALPIRQHVGGVERKVHVVAGGLAFDRDGEVVETSRAREAAITSIAQRLAADGGAALIIDYGHVRSAPGDTLQAVRGHRFAPILADPGEQDLTAHVDFEALAKAARAGGVRATRVVSQGEWLERLGIVARADALMKSNPDRAEELAAAVERLTSSESMGELFKVIAIHAPDWPDPAGFA
jgi:SAM-dependent MidA family methyltransferase